jgi:hypothetical protein
VFESFSGTKPLINPYLGKILTLLLAKKSGWSQSTQVHTGSYLKIRR